MRSINERPTTDYYDDEPIKVPNFMIAHRNRHVKRREIRLEMDAYEILTFIGVIVFIYAFGMLDIHPVGAVIGMIASVVMIIVGGINKNDRY